MENPNIIYGRNSVLEAILSGKRTINKILLSKTAHGSVISEIVRLAKEKGIIIQNIPPEKLKIGTNSQGIAAEISAIEYLEIEKLIEFSKRNANPLLVILDSIEDPHNLGAIIRNCAAFGVDGIIIPKRRAVAVNETVSKASAGAIEHINISRISNINQTIELLKENGFWIAGAEYGAESIVNMKLTFPLVIVIGGENSGLHQLTKKHCDFLISIPQTNAISSLNASCASAVILYEIYKKKIALI
jgi:23S rRNA (guanosine2251-2'-O)-methyltransferase